MNRCVHTHYFRFLALPLFILLLLVYNTLAYDNHDNHAHSLFTQPEPKRVLISTEEQYLNALKTADELTFQQEFELEFFLLLDKQQRQDYLSLSNLEDRKAYIELYWRAVNPNPLLPENDRLIDHIRRRNYARKHFPSSLPPYIDDRGKYYIKYGEPSFRYEDRGGIKRVAFLNSNDPESFYTVFPNESWSYEKVARDFVVHFKQDGNEYHEIGSLSEIIVGPRRRVALVWQWSDILKKRASISPILSRAALVIESFETALIHSNFTASPGLMRSDIQMSQERLFNIIKANEVEIIKANHKAPSVAHDPIHAKNELTFYDTIAQFRNENRGTRVEISILMPLKKNFVHELDSLSNDISAIEFRGLLRNRRFEYLVQDSMITNVPVKLAGLENLPNVIGRLSFDVIPQQTELTLQVKDQRTGILGFSRQPLKIRDFRGRQLMMSDLQFLAVVTNPNKQKLLPYIEKNNLRLAPYPYLKVHRSIPLFCNFEIYNLPMTNITNNIEITYKLVKVKQRKNVLEKVTNWVTDSKKPSLSISYTQPIHEESTQQLISIDLSKIPNGYYQFGISVTANDDKNFIAKAQQFITIVD